MVFGIRKVQENYNSTVGSSDNVRDGVYRTTLGGIWITGDATDLQLRLCIIGHCAASGHRGMKVTEVRVLSQLYWATLSDDVRFFVQACLHFPLKMGGEKVPQPIGYFLHVTKANNLLHFDFLKSGQVVKVRST